MNISAENWWQSNSGNYPSAFWADQRLMEIHRFRSLLLSPTFTQDVLWTRLRRSATLLEVALLEETSEQTPKKAWEIIALIHEAIGTVERQKKEYQWILSSLAWQLAELPAVAGLLASRILSETKHSQYDLFERMVLAFSCRDFSMLRGLAEEAIDEGQKRRQQAIDSTSIEEALETVMLLSVGTVMRDLARYVSFVNNEAPTRDGFKDFLVTARIAGNSRRFRVGRLLAECIDRFIQSSSRLIIESNDNLSFTAKEQIQPYLRQYPELWPCQKEAINSGLLDQKKKNFVVALPTSSGKTLCGELSIIQQLSEHPYSTCFYVVPTRALVEEKSLELKRKLESRFKIKVAAATSALQQDELEGSILANARIVICTPEKLDLLIRHNDSVLTNASLFIIDEAHMIGDDERGLSLEFVVIKLLLLKPSARILLLSAMLPNSEDFGRWLAQEDGVYSSLWRPTRLRFGAINFQKKVPSGVNLNLTIYGQANETDDLEVPLQSFKRQPKTGAEKVIWAVEALRRRGPVLVFSMSKARCEEIVQKIVEYLKSQLASYPIKTEDAVNEDVEKLRRKIKREIADDFLLGEALAFGVAYHHADLPPRIRVELEHLLSTGVIDVIVCTTTLAEGVNLPISTVIFEDWASKGDARQGEKPVPLNLSKFRNIAGRAGRAGKETEGLILFLDPGRKPIKLPNEEEISTRDYFIRAIYPAIQSRFLGIVRHQALPSDELLDHLWNNGDSMISSEVKRPQRQIGLAVLHALEVLSDLDTQTLIEKVSDLSLLAVQSPSTIPKAREWFSQWIKFYQRVNTNPKELRPIAMQVGLPLRAVQQLYAKISGNSDFAALFISTANTSHLSFEQIKAISRIISEIDELDWTPPEAPHNQLIEQWLSGFPISVLKDTYAPYLKSKSRQIEKTCNYTTQHLSNSGSWGGYAFARVAGLAIPNNLSPVVKRIPLLMYFGVNSTPAAQLCLLGLERIDAVRLGSAFLAEGFTESTLDSIKQWVRTKEIKQLEGILSGNDQRGFDREILETVVGKLDEAQG